MTTTASYSPAVSAGNGATTSFSVPWPFLQDADLKVYLLDSATQDPATGTLQVQGTNYTLTGDRRAGTASVVMAVPPAVGKQLARVRSTSRLQSADFVPGVPPSSATIEDALDRQAMVTEEAIYAAVRAVLVPAGESQITLPSLSARLGKFLAFNALTGAPEAQTPGLPSFTFLPTVTGAAGSDASVAVGGTPSNITLQFTLPRGSAGLSGALSNGTYSGIVVTSSGANLDVVAGHITLPRMANLVANSIIGNNTGGAATPAALTGTQVTAMLDLATTAAKGLAPARPASGATSKYLRGDGSYVELPVEYGVACSDETTALTAGANKAKFRMPFAMNVTDVRGSLSTAQTSGGLLTIDVNESGASILSTKLTFDNGETTTTMAAAAEVESDTVLADDAEITIDIDSLGDGTAKGLKIVLIGTRA